MVTPAAAAERVRVRAYPVIELFGPTIQGEGPDAGQPCLFVRLGGCDYRCSWCDSMHAVDPEQVREHSTRMTAVEIADALAARPGDARLVILSGGNPALHHCAELVDELHARALLVSVETQGSKWRTWLASVDQLVVSPKPPSSGMATTVHAGQLRRFMALAADALERKGALKVVVFDHADLAWAVQLHRDEPHVPFYLSAGTDRPEPGESITDTRERVATRFAWLCEQVALNPSLADARVLPQLHVIAWGHALAV